MAAAVPDIRKYRHGLRVIVATACVHASFFSLAASAEAQIVMALPAADGGEEEKNLPGFQVQVDDSLATSFKDFERFAARKDWEKAFRAISEIPAEQRTGMMKAGNGLIIPARMRIWNAVADLPADGREAFRVFFDAKAREIFGRTADSSAKLEESLKLARQVFDEYFLTSVGDDAANLLGDAAFEKGDFRAADLYWKKILDHHPNSDLSELHIHVKRAIAVSRSGRHREFVAMLNDFEQRFTGETVVIGGEDVDPVAFLKTLTTTSEQTQPDTRPDDSAHLAQGVLPMDMPVAWRLQFLSDKGKTLLDNAVSSNYWYRNGMETVVPSYASEGSRLFCNWFGIVFAVDTTTGKLLWRSDKFDKLHSQFSQMPHSSSNIDQYTITVGGGTVLAVSLDPKRLNYHREPFRMAAYEAETGEVRWKSESLEPLKQQGFVGQPMIVGENVLVTTHGRNETKLVLRSLKLSDGSENWSKDLGTATHVKRGRRHQEHMPSPLFHRSDDSLMVLTNNGALIVLDAQGQDVQWVLKYRGPPNNSNNNNIFYGNEPIEDAIVLHSQGVILENAGTVFFKEAGSRELYAVDPSGPTVLWKRPIADEAVLAGADDELLYVLTREIMAFDRKTNELRWARRLPIVGGGLSVVVGKETLFVFTKRGIYCLDKEAGSLRGIFRGADLETNGGWIEVVGDRLICISNMTVTGYAPPWTDDQTTEAAEQQDASNEPATSQSTDEASGS